MSIVKPIPEIWLPALPAGAIQHIIIHWNAGTHEFSALDKAHYHFGVTGALEVKKGIWSVKSNARPFRVVTGYAAHTKNFNAGAVGLAICGMGGATENPFKAGKWPITLEQWDLTAKCAAQISLRYGVVATNYTGIMQHGEVQKRTGVKQNGKWDVCKLPFEPNWNHEQVERDFRLRVQKHVALMK